MKMQFQAAGQLELRGCQADNPTLLNATIKPQITGNLIFFDSKEFIVMAH